MRTILERIDKADLNIFLTFCCRDHTPGARFTVFTLDISSICSKGGIKVPRQMAFGSSFCSFCSTDTVAFIQ